MHPLITGSCCALLFSIAPTFAASIYRCSDAAGNITFTRQGCPIDQTAQAQEATNLTPSSGKAVPMAKPIARRKTQRERATQSLIVVGTQDDGCGNSISGSARRDALIKQQVLPGMTRTEIESTFGTPDSVSSRNGQVQYRYSSDKSRKRTISFDENGCVRGKR
jgi:hypothetical protein